MGRVGNISSGLSGKTAKRGVRSTRISKKDAADKPKRHRSGTHSARTVAKATQVNEKPLVIEEFDSVWDALGFSPAEAANLEARSSLMMQIRELIRTNGWTQAVAAKRCGVSQPRINDLLRGRIDKFSIDALVNIAATLGQRVHIEFRAA